MTEKNDEIREIEEKDAMIDSKEERRRKSLIVIVNNNNEIENISPDSELTKILGFDMTKTSLGTNFYDFLNSAINIEEDYKKELAISLAEKKVEENGKDFSIDNRFYHLHFCIQEMLRGNAFYIKDETNLTHLKRELEKTIQHYMDDLNMLGHELRNPLATSGGFVKNLLRKIETKEKISNEEFEQKLKIIQNEIDRMNTTLNNVLNTERLIHGSYPLKKEKIDMYIDVIEPVLSYLEISEKMVKKRVVIDHKASMNPGEAILYADKDYCRILYRNLFENALKHIKPKGRLSYGVQDIGKDYLFNVYNEGDIIPADMIDKIFDKWTTGDKNGTGLGLYLARLIVEKHGGEICAESGRCEGANIIFSLPKNN